MYFSMDKIIYSSGFPKAKRQKKIIFFFKNYSNGLLLEHSLDERKAAHLLENEKDIL